MGIKSNYRLFLAVPLDVATRKMYEDVAKMLKEKNPALTITVGTAEIGPSPQYSDIETFKAQNLDLFEKYSGEVQKADIVVADLTNNNPNVFVILGIALALGKNVFRVTGRSLTEHGFALTNYETFQYQDRMSLYNKISDYLNTYMKIKKLPLQAASGSLYFSLPNLRLLNANKPRGVDVEILPNFKMCDGAVKFTFDITGKQSDTDWFGVFFRVGYENPFMGSYLLYIRKNGWVELVSYPGPTVLHKEQFLKEGINAPKSFSLEFEGDVLHVAMGNTEMVYPLLRVHVHGMIGFGCYQSSAVCTNIEAVCRDTSEPSSFRRQVMF
ncbi:MAG TPA: hypothetical protein PK876_10345 [Elusimicrobiota bacterium]|nr:hypothetical protein [Elusimicrobiota bacterium]